MTYTVYGPFKVDKAALHSGGKALNAFWEQDGAADVAERKGVYVFGIRAGKGITPQYVGKATKAFRSECFTSHKLHKYVSAISSHAGTPVLFFVVRPLAKGQIKKRQVKEMENYLIVAGWEKNPDIRNIQGVGKPDWCIHGVLRSPKGHPGLAAIQFRSMMAM